MRTRTVIHLLALSLLFPFGAQAQARQLVVVLDASASRAQGMQDQGRHFVDELIDGMHQNDQMILMEMQDQGITDAPVLHTFVIPVMGGAGSVARQKASTDGYKRSLSNSVLSFFKVAEAKKTQHTDILSTLSLIQEKIRDARGRTSTVLLLSDMLQSAKGIEMERWQRVPATNDFVRQSQANGTMPDLGGACILVVGADASTAAGVKVRNFWQSYFHAASANFKATNYRTTPPTVSEDFCH
jgi:hypothetical protein